MYVRNKSFNVARIVVYDNNPWIGLDYSLPLRDTVVKSRWRMSSCSQHHWQSLKYKCIFWHVLSISPHRLGQLPILHNLPLAAQKLRIFSTKVLFLNHQSELQLPSFYGTQCLWPVITIIFDCLNNLYMYRGRSTFAPLRNGITDWWGKHFVKANTKKKASSHGQRGGGGLHTSCTLPLDLPLM